MSDPDGLHGVDRCAMKRVVSGYLCGVPSLCGESGFELARKAAEVARFRRVERDLTTLEREVLCRRYGLGRPRQDLAEVVSTLRASPQQVLDAERRALNRVWQAFGLT